MTASPHTRISDLKVDSTQPSKKRVKRISLGTFFATGFVAVVALIARRFYQ